MSQQTVNLLRIASSILFSPATIILHFLSQCSANMVPLCQLLKKDATWTQPPPPPRLRRSTTVHQATAHQPLSSPGYLSLDEHTVPALPVLEWNSHSPPLVSSKKLWGWEEASRWPVGIWTHLFLWWRLLFSHRWEDTQQNAGHEPLTLFWWIKPVAQCGEITLEEKQQQQNTPVRLHILIYSSCLFQITYVF